jgi:hypothetical protein
MTYALREARQAALDVLPAQIAALASRNDLCAQSARIPGPRPGPRPSQPPVTECYQLGLGSPSTRPPVSRRAYTRTAPVPDLALTETLAQLPNTRDWELRKS